MRFLLGLVAGLPFGTHVVNLGCYLVYRKLKFPFTFDTEEMEFAINFKFVFQIGKDVAGYLKG